MHRLPTKIEALNFENSFLWYGPDLDLIRQTFKRTPQGQTLPVEETVYYVGDLYERRFKPAGTEHRDYIRAGGKTIAIRTVKTTGEVELLYLHRDHLGSVDTVTSANGAVAESLSYDSFGKRRSPSWFQDPNDFQTNQAEHKP